MSIEETIAKVVDERLEAFLPKIADYIMSQTRGKYAEYPDSLTPDEAAQIMRKSRRIVYDMLKRNEITGVRVGRDWRIPKQVVVKYLESAM